MSAERGPLDRVLDEIDALTPEARTLFLARAGVSPLDMEAGLKRCMEKIEAFEREQEAARILREGGR